MKKSIPQPNLTDMPTGDFRKYAKDSIEWVCEYFDNIESYPVLPNIKPGDIRKTLDELPPEIGENFDKILSDFDEKIIPGITHWNHPNFNAYFSNSGSAPTVIADLLAAALNVNVMLWKTSPSATELEQLVMEWMRDLLGLPEYFFGMIVDTASSATFTSVVAAREAVSERNIRMEGFYGKGVYTPMVMYCSEHAHSSVDKAALASGIGVKNLRKVPVDNEYRMNTEVLEDMIKGDIAKGFKPFCVVSTFGTTSTTSVDPIETVGDICKKFELWHHVDGAYAGVITLLPEFKKYMDGFANVDSYVTNPHKWLFTPIDSSLLFFKDPEHVKNSFSIVPEYLMTKESSEAVDYMNYGIQLGRRFRSLKLWFVIRYFGVEGLQNRLREHLRLTQVMLSSMQAHPDVQICAPVPFSVICFRFNPKDKNLTENKIEALNAELMNDLNKTGKIYISHTKIDGKFILRYAVGNIRIEEKHVKSSWELIFKTADNLL